LKSLDDLLLENAGNVPGDEQDVADEYELEMAVYLQDKYKKNERALKKGVLERTSEGSDRSDSFGRGLDSEDESSRINFD